MSAAVQRLGNRASGRALFRAGSAAYRQRPDTGNGLVFALLGLLVSSLVAAGVMQAGHLQVRREAGNSEATLLEAIRNAANNAIFESMIDIQDGKPITKNGVTLAPVEIDGESVWQPSIPDLVGMGYLPSGWSAIASVSPRRASGFA